MSCYVKNGRLFFDKVLGPNETYLTSVRVNDIITFWYAVNTTCIATIDSKYHFTTSSYTLMCIRIRDYYREIDNETRVDWINIYIKELGHASE